MRDRDDTTPAGVSTVSELARRVTNVEQLRSLVRRRLRERRITERRDDGTVVKLSLTSEQAGERRKRVPIGPGRQPGLRGKLLTAADERRLGRAIEDAHWIFDIEDDFTDQFDEPPSSLVIVMMLLLQAELMLPDIAAIADALDKGDGSVGNVIRDPVFCARLDGAADSQFVSLIAGHVSASGVDLHTQSVADWVVKISIVTRLLALLDEWPEVVLEQLLPCSATALEHLERHPKQCDRFVQRVIHDGALAERQFIEANQRLIWSVLRKHGAGMPHSDLAQEANFGLLRAVEKFDYRRGIKFSTYATGWIRHAIGRAAADQSRTIRLPVYVVGRLNKLRKVREDLVHLLGREPTDDETACAMGLEQSEINMIRSASEPPVSLEILTDEQQPSTLLDEFMEDDPGLRGFDEPMPNPLDDLEDDITVAPDDAAFQRLLKETVTAVLHSLSPREREVLELRFGLHDGRSRTLEEVGKVFDVTRERIRQIEAKALRKLRHPMRATRLRDYIE